MDPNHDHSITLPDAAIMTERFRNNNAGAIKGHAFGRDAVLAILNQPNCTGLRIYHAQNANGEDRIVLAGIGNNYDDMFNGVLAQESLPEPPFSSIANPLNS